MQTVHVIDDDERSRKLAADVMAAQGFVVLQAGTGAQARINLSEHPADLVLLDIQLPDEDGFQIIAWIRQQPALRTVPVIALTASVMPAYRGRIDESGFTGFISKPLSSVREFVHTVRSYLQPIKPP
ncbi:response regulator [Ideonella sp.]|uniref:response regulator n=1 Tax=Ideonella sp. TaxID=1929293 RepID=UPI003BB4C257